MIQQPGQNQNVVYQNYAVPVVQNQVIANNNQLQYQQQQFALQKAQQRNQIQNNPQLQKGQNVHHHYNNQILNPQVIQQQQNYQNMQNIQRVQQVKQHQNPQTYHNVQIPQTINNKQVIMGANGPKTYIQPPIQNAVNQHRKTHNPTMLKNPQNPTIIQNAQNPTMINNLPNQTIIQNVQMQPTVKVQNPTILKNTKQIPNQVPMNVVKQQLNASHLNLGQTPTLEPVAKEQLQHIQLEQKNKHKHHQHHHQQEPQTKQQNPPINQAENLQNTIMPVPMPNQAQQPNPNTNITKKSATFMTVRSLANLPYNQYPVAEYSKEPYFNISGYASNSYNGKIKTYNEDMLTVKINCQKSIQTEKEVAVKQLPNISFFGVFDGHGGDKCSKFLKKNMHEILFKTKKCVINEPVEAIRESFQTAENEFKKVAIQNGKLVDKSGSCAVIALIINDIIYAINLGDSRALYSSNGGKEFYQITRDHKPNDVKEKTRIEKNGGKVRYANFRIVNGVEVTYTEKEVGKNFVFPYRLYPCGLAVSLII